MNKLLSALALLTVFLFSQSIFAAPEVNLEEPAANDVYAGVSNIRGWAVSEDGIASISLSIDGEQITDIPWGALRDDVAGIFPAINDAGQSGFSMAFNFGKLAAGPHVMRISVLDNNDVQTEIIRNFNSVSFDLAFITSVLDLGNIELESTASTILIKNLEIEGVFYNVELAWRKSAQGFAIEDISLTPLALLNFAVFDTNVGEFVVELDPGNSPVTVANFKDYASSGFYDDTLIHRIVEDFVIQGGGVDLVGTFKVTNDPIVNEAANGLKNVRGTIAMARTSDPHSATSQFFINRVDSAHLDHVDNTDIGFGYAVFGKVVSGMDVVDDIGIRADNEVIVNSVVLKPTFNP